jgi:hypothetical protein
MRIGAQDVQVVEEGDDIEAAYEAAQAKYKEVEKAYEDARDARVTLAEEGKFGEELGRIYKQFREIKDEATAKFNAKHGLTELAAKVEEARVDLENFEADYFDDSDGELE